MGLPTLPKDLSFEKQSVLITGSNTGIGLELARVFLRRKAKTVYLVVRSLERGNNAVTQLQQDAIISKENPTAEIKVYQCDQSSIESTLSFAKKFKEEVKSLNIVILNAGVNNMSFVPTVDGWESNFQINYFGAALVALELLPLLKEGKKNGVKSNLFFTSSLMHTKASVSTTAMLAEDVNVLEYLAAKENRPWDPSQPYSISKFLLTTFAEELARRETDVVSTSGCPGIVLTELDRNLPFWLKGPVVLMKKLIGREVFNSAETLTPAIITDKTGTYWADGVVKPHASLLDTENGKKLQRKLYEQTLQKCKELDPDISLPA
ncbi:hypothetical protein TWF225_006756 [Orbilia oligospora]|nr:hypothetical protein TWF225_006756 [Orbilia oligospora]KAF3233767.1 hypothetical protein TWF128_002879 [Orbilia oligospora]KAF3237474.1 hypothetical protein TWF217_002098 [Orbilia oligospora]KAF3279975.1 hypothetical protein TWF132_011990 [Orbilia oligospora]